MGSLAVARDHSRPVPFREQPLEHVGWEARQQHRPLQNMDALLHLNRVWQNNDVASAIRREPLLSTSLTRVCVPLGGATTSRIRRTARLLAEFVPSTVILDCLLFTLWRIDTPAEPQQFPLLYISLGPINMSQCAAAWASDRSRSSSNMYLSSIMSRAAASN